MTAYQGSRRKEEVAGRREGGRKGGRGRQWKKITVGRRSTGSELENKGVKRSN